MCVYVYVCICICVYMYMCAICVYMYMCVYVSCAETHSHSRTHRTHTAKHTTKCCHYILSVYHTVSLSVRDSLSVYHTVYLSLCQCITQYTSPSPSPSPSPSHRAIAMGGEDTIVACPGSRDVDDSRIKLAVASPGTG
jgi:hypothetical protein